MARINRIREQCDKCRHFTGIGTNADGSRVPLSSKSRGSCSANVKYDDVFKQGKRMIALPCFHPERDNIPPDGAWPTCPHLSFKTPEELDKEAAEHEEHFRIAVERITVVRPAILKHAGWKQSDVSDDEIPAGARRAMDGVTSIAKEAKDARGRFPCPVCKTGTLAYSIAAFNGHVHAHCSTDKCVSWME